MKQLFNKNILKFVKKSYIYITIFVLILFLIYLLFDLLYISPCKCEGFTTIIEDCSKCHVKPSGGDCIEIPIVQYNNQVNSGMDISFITTVSGEQLVFCPWKEECSRDKPLFKQDTLSNTTDVSGIYKYNCCPDSEFYDNYTRQYNLVDEIINNAENCTTFLNDIKKPGTTDIDGINPLDIQRCRKIVNDLTNKDISGLLFKRIYNTDVVSLYKSDILNNPDVKAGDLKNYLTMRYASLETNLEKQQRGKSPNTPEYKRYMSYKTIINDLNQRAYDSDVTSLKQDLWIKVIKEWEENIGFNMDNYDDYKWKLLNRDGNAITGNTNSYILNPDEFYDCNGTKQTVKTAKAGLFTFGDASFADTETEIYNNSFFGSSSDTIKTLGEYRNTNLSNTNDLDMEIKRLQTIPNSQSTAPVGIINQYLNQINSFYNKQLNNMLGPATHSQQKKLQFIDNDLSIKKTTFFKYDMSSNDVSYATIPSMTGDSQFNYTGPSPYMDNNSITFL